MTGVVAPGKRQAVGKFTRSGNQIRSSGQGYIASNETRRDVAAASVCILVLGCGHGGLERIVRSRDGPRALSADPRARWTEKESTSSAEVRIDVLAGVACRQRQLQSSHGLRDDRVIVLGEIESRRRSVEVAHLGGWVAEQDGR